MSKVNSFLRSSQFPGQGHALSPHGPASHSVQGTAVQAPDRSLTAVMATDWVQTGPRLHHRMPSALRVTWLVALPCPAAGGRGVPWRLAGRFGDVWAHQPRLQSNWAGDARWPHPSHAEAQAPPAPRTWPRGCAQACGAHSLVRVWGSARWPRGLGLLGKSKRSALSSAAKPTHSSPGL